MFFFFVGLKLPWVEICNKEFTKNKMCRNSVGHPSIIRHDFNFLDRYFGLVKSKKCQPRLIFPVLPAKCNDKLMFAQCRTCSKKSSTQNVSTKTKNTPWPEPGHLPNFNRRCKKGIHWLKRSKCTTVPSQKSTILSLSQVVFIQGTSPLS